MVPGTPRPVLTSADVRRCAVIGHPVAHSLSPALHRSAYRHLGLDWEYGCVDVPPGQLSTFLSGLDERWRGLSVTMPHKQELLLFGAGDATTELVGAANTLVLEPPGSDGAPRRVVRNTDVGGFVAACAAHGLTEVRTATMLGAGATARAALVALANMGLHSLALRVRDPQRATNLTTLAAQLGIDVSVAGLGVAAPPGGMLVSTLPGDAAAPWADEATTAVEAIFDVSYDPWPTPLAAAALRRQVTMIDGLDLLAGQAVGQVQLFTGSSVDFALLQAAGRDELRRRRLL